MSPTHNQFPNDVVELMNYFRGANGRVRAIPGEGLDVPIYILGSSLYGAQLAAALGLPYAFASHFAPQMMMEAIDVYRHRFEPSEQLDRPYVMLGFNAFVADTDEEARAAGDVRAAGIRRVAHGQPTQLPPPARGFAETLPMQSRAILTSVLSCSAIGSPETARRQVEAFVERTKADELIVTSQIYDLAARIRSYEHLMEALSQAPPALSQ